MRRKPDVAVPGGRARPRPEEYGLPPSFNYGIYQRQSEQFEARVWFVGAWWTVGLFIASQVLLYVVYDAMGWNTGLVALTAAPPMCAGVIWGINALIKPRVWESVRKQFLERGMLEIAYHGRADAYVEALKEWNYSQTEAGFGYWKALKSVDFERAVASFFQRRGGLVQLTKVTGDGGVDIILQLGTSTYWCQCKGYAKPVAVAAIRQIAGAAMKSGGAATPVMFSTNGYTKPALEEAATLGVTCIDGLRLSQMAQRQTIASL